MPTGVAEDLVGAIDEEFAKLRFHLDEVERYEVILSGIAEEESKLTVLPLPANCPPCRHSQYQKCQEEFLHFCQSLDRPISPYSRHVGGCGGLSSGSGSSSGSGGGDKPIFHDHIYLSPSDPSCRHETADSVEFRLSAGVERVRATYYYLQQKAQEYTTAESRGREAGLYAEDYCGPEAARCGLSLSPVLTLVIVICHDLPIIVGLVLPLLFDPSTWRFWKRTRCSAQVVEPFSRRWPMLAEFIRSPHWCMYFEARHGPSLRPRFRLRFVFVFARLLHAT